MIGVIGTAGRAVATQLAREVSREIGKRALQRLISREGGEGMEQALRRLLSREGMEDLVSRDMMKRLGKKGVQMLSNEIGRETINDYNKKMNTGTIE